MLKKEIIPFIMKLWDYHNLTSTLKNADYIVGLGSYDVKVAKRCAQLYHKKLAPFIIFSGKNGNWTKGKWSDTEAATFKAHAISYDIPEKEILLEENSTNLGENIKYVKGLLSTRNPLLKRIIIVTKPNTQRRALATAQKVWPEIECMVTSPEVNFNEQIKSHLCSFEILTNEMVGDVQRIYLYSSMGFQVHQHIPKEIWDAYSTLVGLGFDKHLIQPWDFQLP